MMHNGQTGNTGGGGQDLILKSSSDVKVCEPFMTFLCETL